ncbi:hypothetical protein H8959_004479, partial [Pygathrix nigripes]
ELPPPYTAIASPDASGIPVINCRVCQSLINLDGKLHQHVVKCTVCNEATPIKNPPTGKKYVRCPCNCLLICKDTSRRIGCPRPNCRRIINLGPVMLISEEQPAQPALPIQPEGTRVVCGHCGNTFLCSEISLGCVLGQMGAIAWGDNSFNLNIFQSVTMDGTEVQHSGKMPTLQKNRGAGLFFPRLTPSFDYCTPFSLEMAVCVKRCIPV